MNISNIQTQEIKNIPVEVNNIKTVEIDFKQIMDSLIGLNTNIDLKNVLITETSELNGIKKELVDDLEIDDKKEEILDNLMFLLNDIKIFLNKDTINIKMSDDISEDKNVLFINEELKELLLMFKENLVNFKKEFKKEINLDDFTILKKEISEFIDFIETKKNEVIIENNKPNKDISNNDSVSFLEGDKGEVELKKTDILVLDDNNTDKIYKLIQKIDTNLKKIVLKTDNKEVLKDLSVDSIEVKKNPIVLNIKNHILNMDQSISKTSTINYKGNEFKLNIIEQLTNNFKIFKNDLLDEKTITFKLKPEGLGNLSIKLVQEEGNNYKLTMNVDNNLVKSVIENSLIDLKNSLSERGHNLKEVEVSLNSFLFSKEDKNNRNNRQNKKEKQFIDLNMEEDKEYEKVINKFFEYNQSKINSLI